MTLKQLIEEIEEQMIIINSSKIDPCHLCDIWNFIRHHVSLNYTFIKNNIDLAFDLSKIFDDLKDKNLIKDFEFLIYNNVMLLYHFYQEHIRDFVVPMLFMARIEEIERYGIKISDVHIFKIIMNDSQFFYFPFMDEHHAYPVKLNYKKEYEIWTPPNMIA